MDLVRQLDNALQYGEDIEVKAKDIEDNYDEVDIWKKKKLNLTKKKLETWKPDFTG